MAEEELHNLQRHARLALPELDFSEEVVVSHRMQELRRRGLNVMCDSISSQLLMCPVVWKARARNYS